MCFTVSPFHPSLIFACKAGAYPSGVLSKVRFQDLPVNIRLGLTVINSLDYYYNTEFITAIKKFYSKYSEHFIFFVTN